MIYGERVLAVEKEFHVASISLARLRERKIWSPRQLWKYRWAIMRRPEFSSCFDDHAPETATEPEWRLKHLGAGEQIDICLFHLAKRLETPEALNDWFIANGGKSGFWDIFGKIETDRPITVHATAKTGGDNPIKISTNKFYFLGFTANGISVGVRF